MQGMPIVLNQRWTALVSFRPDLSRSLIVCTQYKSMVRPAFSPAPNATSRQVQASFPANSLGDLRLASVVQSHQFSAPGNSAKNKRRNKWSVSGSTFFGILRNKGALSRYCQGRIIAHYPQSIVIPICLPTSNKRPYHKLCIINSEPEYAANRTNLRSGEREYTYILPSYMHRIYTINRLRPLPQPALITKCTAAAKESP